MNYDQASFNFVIGTQCWREEPSRSDCAQVKAGRPKFFTHHIGLTYPMESYLLGLPLPIRREALQVWPQQHHASFIDIGQRQGQPIVVGDEETVRRKGL